MLSLFRRPAARPGRSRGRVVLHLEGFDRRDQPSDPTGTDLSISSTAVFGDGTANQAPEIVVYCQEIGVGQFRVYGRVTDESPGGLTVRLGGIPSAAGRAVVTNPDGSFSMILSVRTDGTDVGFVSAQTTDAQGLNSNVAHADIHPTPPRAERPRNDADARSPDSEYLNMQRTTTTLDTSMDRRLIPILARVLDLGRGPQGLVQWVHARAAGVSDGGSRATVLSRLAGELAGEIRRGAWAGTVLDYNRTIQPS